MSVLLKTRTYDILQFFKGRVVLFAFWMVPGIFTGVLDFLYYTACWVKTRVSCVFSRVFGTFEITKTQTQCIV